MWYHYFALAICLLLLRTHTLPAQDSAVATTERTHIAIQGGRWTINGQVTYPGSPAEGLLMNVRMVNSVFEDTRRPELDPEANTDAFIQRIPEYASHGVLAFTIGLQGGMPGYEGAVNSAFESSGALRPSYLRRVARVIDQCDRQSLVVILGCYYQRQDQLLQDEAAVRRGVENVARWIGQRGWKNVLLEIANEFPHSGFDHAIVRRPEGEAELIQLARKACPGLLVSTSGIGDGRLDEPVARASDFLLIHFNGVSTDEIPQRIESLRRFEKPIVCNEDDKRGELAVRAAELAVENGASWGFMQSDVNQYIPFEFRGAADDPLVYAALRRLTLPSKRER